MSPDFEFVRMGHHREVTRILLLLPTTTYRAADFLAAATRLEVEIVVGSERRQALSRSMGERAVVVPLTNIDVAVNTIVGLHQRTPFDAVVAVDDQGVLIAAGAAAKLGLRHSAPEAVAATRDKARMRELLGATSLRQPAYRSVPPGDEVAPAAAQIGYPCVVKPVSRSASQGVIRINDDSEAREADVRLRALLGDCLESLLVEQFVPGDEVALEGLLTRGRLEVLAVFDKPDPLDGPYFEETIYVTPSRQRPSVLASVEETAARAAAALGLREGPVHVELRVGPEGELTVLELAARSIGGLCARALRFGAGVSLEELILRHALGWGLDGLTREVPASGVMMLPIRTAGILDHVAGQDDARAVAGVVGLEISLAPGRSLVPLPEGDRYLGFIFARGATARFVENSLREAEACLDVRLR